MRVLWSLPKAAPALLRHIAAYVDLAGYEFARAQREWARGLVLCVVLAAALFFAVLMGCVAVLALTWDTPQRLPAIAWLGGGFVAVALIAILWRSHLNRGRAPFFALLRQQWSEDRVILERILSDEE